MIINFLNKFDFFKLFLVIFNNIENNHKKDFILLAVKFIIATFLELFLIIFSGSIIYIFLGDNNKDIIEVPKYLSSLGINEWYVESTSRPQVTINSVEVPFLNTSTYVAGRFVWNTINVTFRDPIGPSAAQALMEWVRLHAESVTGRMGYAAGYKKNIDLELLDPTGVVVEKWILQGTFLTDVNFNDLSYSDDGLANI